MSPAKRLFAVFALVTCTSLAHAAPVNPKVPAVCTPMTRVELLHALRDGYIKVFGETPSKNKLAMAWGQVAFENGGGKYSYNHNLGNVGASAPDQPTYYNTGDRHWYRAFLDFEDGAAGYWQVIRHCSPAFAAFEWGNPRLAAIRLKNCNYFEASLDEYAPSFSSLFNTAITQIIPEDEREQQRKTDELLAIVRRAIESSGTPAAPAADDSGFDFTLARDSD